jgi:hypothetical protein
MMRYNEQETIEEEYPYYSIPSNDIIRFPYCIIQVATEEQQQDTNNSVVQKLESSPMLYPVHDFSTFLHGVGSLFYDQVHVFPSWFSSSAVNIRHITHRGSLLFTEEKVSLEETTNNSLSSSTGGWSSNTIATIITTPTSPSLSSSSSSSSSTCSLLSPYDNNKKLRRSFDSYCSFDHPTSSRSDPNNCKSCMGKLILNQAYDGNRKPKVNQKEQVTFMSFMKNVIEWRNYYPYNTSKCEKEPLILPSHHHHHHIHQDEESLMVINNHKKGISERPTLITLGCVLISFSVSYLFYLFIKK